jgi:lysozyme
MNLEHVTGQLQADEALRLKPYDDATGKELRPGDRLIGKLTIGIGRNLTDNGISGAEAYMLCNNDVRGTIRELDRALPWWSKMSDNRQDALLNMAFNMGVPRLLTFKNALALLEAGRWDAAASEFKNSKWYGQVGDRAERLIKVIKEG